MQAATTTSEKIAHEYANAGRGPNMLKVTIPFNQTKFMNANPQYAESLFDEPSKSLLQDHYTEKAAASGICSALVMHWLSTGSIPSTTNKMIATLSKAQVSTEVDSEPDWLKWHGNMSISFTNLKEVKNSKGLDFKNVKSFINYLLDNSGNIETKYKLFLILVFNNGTSHAVGLDLGTNQFFDPNFGVSNIEFAKEPVKKIAHSILGLEEIRREYGNVDSVQAITYQ